MGMHLGLRGSNGGGVQVAGTMGFLGPGKAPFSIENPCFLEKSI